MKRRLFFIWSTSMYLRIRLLVCSLLLAGCVSNSAKQDEQVYAPSPSLSTPEDAGVIFVGAGDIARCSFSAARSTAQLLDAIPGTVFTTGDNVYQEGTAEEFRECYAPTWGRHKHRTRPAPGNHDYKTNGASPYYEYFGEHAGPAGLGYYSYDLGAWHILSLNSNVPADAHSAQMEWLRGDLAKSAHKCTLAYWHHPIVASGRRAASQQMREIFAVLYAQGVDVVLNGHEHVYERFAPMDPSGVRDNENGIRQFIVGTGGALLGRFGELHPLSEVHFSAHGVIKLTLKPTSYTWEFIPALPDGHVDSGSAVCH